MVIQWTAALPITFRSFATEENITLETAQEMDLDVETAGFLSNFFLNTVNLDTTEIVRIEGADVVSIGADEVEEYAELLGVSIEEVESNESILITPEE